MDLKKQKKTLGYTLDLGGSEQGAIPCAYRRDYPNSIEVMDFLNKCATVMF
jgi:hypothetical protein